MTGRKTVAFYTDGYILRTSQVSYADNLLRAIDMANRANISFYTFDPRGMAGGGGESQYMHVALARDTGGLATMDDAISYPMPHSW